MFSHTPLVFIDVETTGVSARTGGRVIEIGALRVENNKVVAKLKQLLHPEQRIPPFITGITGITDNDVKNAPIFEQIADDVNNIFKDAVFVAHNVNFDYRFIQSEFDKIGGQFIKDRLCTVRLSRSMFPEHKSHALDRIIERHGFSVSNRHRAYDDAEIIYKFYNSMLENDERKLMEAMNKNLILCSNHG